MPEWITNPAFGELAKAGLGYLLAVCSLPIISYLVFEVRVQNKARFIEAKACLVGLNSSTSATATLTETMEKRLVAMNELVAAFKELARDTEQERELWKLRQETLAETTRTRYGEVMDQLRTNRDYMDRIERRLYGVAVPMPSEKPPVPRA